jgi:glycosyltransferase involved in cell wall biosynthesis
MKLNLAIDAIGIKHSGGATVLTDVLNAATADSRIGNISVFCSPRARRLFNLPASDKIHQIECRVSEANRIYRLWWIENRLRCEVQRRGGDVLLCLTGIGSARGYPPHVTMIQQSLPFFPEISCRTGSFEWLRMSVMLRAMRRSCTSSQHVIVQTPTMRKRVAEEFRLPPERISVILPAVSDLPPPIIPSERLATMRATNTGLRLLYVGNQSAYKNVELVVRAFGKLRTLLNGLKLFLTWPPDHPVCRSDGIVGLGYLQGAVLREAYELATVLVMPSLMETVGFPMLEAMSVGTPVIAADLPYAHDVCGEAAVFFDPLDTDDLAAKAADLLGSQQLQRDLISRGYNVIQRRRAERPYEDIIDILAAVAYKHGVSGIRRAG